MEWVTFRGYNPLPCEYNPLPSQDLFVTLNFSLVLNAFLLLVIFIIDMKIVTPCSCTKTPNSGELLLHVYRPAKRVIR